VFVVQPALHPGCPGAVLGTMMLRASVRVNPIFLRNLFRHKAIGCNELQECQTAFLAGQTAMLRDI
jgi:hypothetical protein